MSMKKIILSLAALFVLSMAFTSCGGDFGMQVLDADDVTSSWVEDSTWSGTVTTKISGNSEILEKNGVNYTAGTVDVEGKKLSAEIIKIQMASDGLNVFGLETKYCAKANARRTKLIMESEMTYTLLKESVTVKITESYTKD